MLLNIRCFSGISVVLGVSSPTKIVLFGLNPWEISRELDLGIQVKSTDIHILKFTNTACSYEMVKGRSSFSDIQPIFFTL